MTFISLYIIALFNVLISNDIDTNIPVTDNPVTDLSEAEEPEIKWYSWEEAFELNKSQPKKIFIDLYTNWCGWCKKMDRETFTNPDIVEYLNDHFYAVKFNAEQTEPITFNNNKFEFIKSGRRGVHQLAYALLDGRLGYPAFVTLDESYARIMISPGYKKPNQLIKELEFAKEEKYRQMSFEDYMAQ